MSYRASLAKCAQMCPKRWRSALASVLLATVYLLATSAVVEKKLIRPSPKLLRSIPTTSTSIHTSQQCPNLDDKFVHVVSSPSDCTLGEVFPCNVPCVWPRRRRGILQTVAIAKTNITVTLSMESEAYYPTLKLHHQTKTHWIGSTRFDSDLPMPYFSWAEYNIQAKHVRLEHLIPKASFVARNCNSKSQREKLVKFLADQNLVASLSSCLHNTEAAQTRDKAQMIRPYALHLAFENSIVDDYITEKLWGTLAAGVLPVYFGAPNVRDHVPNNSVIVVADYGSDWDALARHIKAVISDAALYESYHAWRYKPLPRWFKEKYAFTHTHSSCRLCQRIAQLSTNKYG